MSGARGRVLQRRLAISAGIVTMLVLSVAGVASASWTTSAGTVTSVSAGTTSLTVTGTNALGYGYQFGGEESASPVVIKAIVVANTGTAPLIYTLAVLNAASNAASTPLAPSITLSLWLQVASSCGTTVPGGATVGTLVAPPALPAGTTSAVAGSSFSLCVATSLKATVAATTGTSVAATFTINGRVGTSNWMTAGSGTFSQASLTLCTQGGGLFGLLGNPVVLTLLTPSGIGPYSYRLVLASSPMSVVKAAQMGTAINLTSADLSAYGSPVVLRAQASNDGFATIASTVDQKVSFQPGVANLLLASVTCLAP